LSELKLEEFFLNENGRRRMECAVMRLKIIVAAFGDIFRDFQEQS
jgi:hypothetical protein